MARDHNSSSFGSGVLKITRYLIGMQTKFCLFVFMIYLMSGVKRKSISEHAQCARIKVIMRSLSVSQAFAFHCYIGSI